MSCIWPIESCSGHIEYILCKSKFKMCWNLAFYDTFLLEKNLGFYRESLRRFFFTRFFPQIAPPGPIWDVQGQFWFFLLLGWDISILKWLPQCPMHRFPGVLSTIESRLPGVLSTWESRLLTALWVKILGVLCTGESRLPGIHIWKFS